jgi:hypothetical protein
MRDIAFQRRPKHQRPRRFVEGADIHQHAAHIRMHDDGIGRLLREFRAGQRASGEALLRVSGGVLIGDFRQRQTLQADIEPRLVHHDEHGLQAAIGLPHQPAGCAIVIHHAGGIAVNAHFLLERAAAHCIAYADAAVRRRRQEFRNEEQ